MHHVVWGIDKFFEKLTPEIGLNLKNIQCAQCFWDWGFNARSVFFLNIFNGNLHFDALITDKIKYLRRMEVLKS